MTQEELETQIRNWIQKEEFEKIEYFILDTIVGHHLQKQENKKLSDIENWERIRGLLLHKNKENQVLGFQLLEGQGSKNISDRLSMFLVDKRYNDFNLEFENIKVYVEREKAIQEQAGYLENKIILLEKELQKYPTNIKLKQELFENKEALLQVYEELHSISIRDEVLVLVDDLFQLILHIFQKYNINILKIRF